MTMNQTVVLSDIIGKSGLKIIETVTVVEFDNLCLAALAFKYDFYLIRIFSLLLPLTLM